jgi:hypothetical protein
VSDPFNLHRCVLDFRHRGHHEQEVIDIFHNNPVKFFSQSPNWKLKPLIVEHADDETITPTARQSIRAGAH